MAMKGYEAAEEGLVVRASEAGRQKKYIQSSLIREPTQNGGSRELLNLLAADHRLQIQSCALRT